MAEVLKIPIFAIDYRLAPKTTFPNNIKDCVAGLFWIFQFIKETYNVEVENFVIMGDSSGGNFATSLVYWLIENKKKLPCFLSLCYPCMRIRYNTFTPSMLLILEELLLSYGSMDIILHSYLDDAIYCNMDPFVSPVLAESELLKLMPYTAIYVGTIDPLYDDSVRFIQKLTKLNRKCKLISFEHQGHGLLNKPQDFLPAKPFFDTVTRDILRSINNANN